MVEKCRVLGLTKRFGAATVVDDVALDVAEGEFVVILGPSGCGKTTTLRMIAGLAEPDAGSIDIDGRRVCAPAERLFVPPEQRNIGMVFQSYAIWPHMTVFENVAYPLRVRRVGGNERKRRVADVLERVGLGHESNRPATALSGGQMQRVALARALVFNPAMVLFDEPLSNLDLKLRERLRVELKSLQRETGLTSIYVTHDQTEAVELADRIIVMEAGRVVQTGTPRELYREPASRFVAEFISTANIFEAVVEGFANPGFVRIRCDNGRVLIAAHTVPVLPGERVDVVIHPEDCRIEVTQGEHAHPVRITGLRYQGTSTRITLRWMGTEIDVVSLGTLPAIEEGSEAWLHIRPEHARVIPRPLP
jgi:iron(III) transport system ATP-binding protein